MSTGYFVGGEEMTREEARKARLPVRYEAGKVPNYTIPTYNTGDRLFSRVELEQMFRDQWGQVITAGDVDSFIKWNFWSRNGCQPTSLVPFRPVPEVPEETTDDNDAQRILTSWVNARQTSRKSRERFRIHGLEMYVPSIAIPTAGDEPDHAKRKADRINAL
jgi:hypothetical protein